jgi:hypothetical protein
VLRLRRGVVRSAGAAAATQQLEVELADGSQPAIATVALVGRCEPGDDVIVNVTARELGLGSGGFDIVHVNLTRGLEAPLASERVLALGYTSIQHGVDPVETRLSTARLQPAAAVAVIAIHGQLPAVAWAFAQAAPGQRLGYVQTAGGALPASHSRVAAELAARGLLHGRLAAAPAFDGADGDAVTTAGALVYGFSVLGWDAAVCGPGPGILGTGSLLGHGALGALDSLHTAAALGARTLVVPRMSSADSRERHRGLSHHTRTVLELLLMQTTVALPAGEEQPDAPGLWIEHTVDLDGYAQSGLPTETMGLPLEQDRLFFAAALAGGGLLAQLVGAQ